MNNTQRINLMMPEIMINNLNKLADKTFESRSNLIRQAVKEYLNRRLLEEGISDKE